MKRVSLLVSIVASVGAFGCGDGGDAKLDAPVAPPPVQAPVTASAIPAATPVATAPPTATTPVAIDAPPDPLDSIKVSRDGSPNKTDLEALQAVVDAYAIGIDGLGAPAIANLDVLVAKGFLRKIPEPPAGKKWAYDSATWKVSLVDK